MNLHSLRNPFGLLGYIRVVIPVRLGFNVAGSFFVFS